MSAGQRSGPLLRSRGESRAIQSRIDTGLSLGGRYATQRQRVLDVLVHGHVGEEVEALKDQADVEIAHARLFGR